MFTGASTKLSTKSILDTLCSDQLSFIILYSCVVVWVVFFVSCFLFFVFVSQGFGYFNSNRVMRNNVVDQFLYYLC